MKKAARRWNRLCSCWPHPVYLGEKGDDHHHICKHLIIDPNFDLEPRPDCSSAVTKWNQTCWLLCGSVKLKVYWYKCVINVLHAEGAFTNRMDTKQHKFTTIRTKRETNQLFLFQTDVCRNLTTLIWFSHFSNHSSHMQCSYFLWVSSSDPIFVAPLAAVLWGLNSLWASSLGLSLAFISSSNSADMGMEICRKDNRNQFQRPDERFQLTFRNQKNK